MTAQSSTAQERVILEGDPASSWCSFIPNRFLSMLANDDGASAEIRKNFKRTMEEGEALLAKAEALTLEDLSEPLGRNSKLRRFIYNARHKFDLPTNMKVVNNGEVAGRAMDGGYMRVMNNLDSIFEFFRVDFGHELFGEQGHKLGVIMNYGSAYMNAHWTGSLVILGSGNMNLLDGFSAASDILAHEITHGIVIRSSGLQKTSEPGALSEHLADVFGILYKQRQKPIAQDAKDCSWVIGEGLWLSHDRQQVAELFKTPEWLIRYFGPENTEMDPKDKEKILNIHLKSLGQEKRVFDNLPHYLRSLSDPTSTNPEQPYHYDDYRELDYDNGGVHHNSGIANYAFYTAAVTAGGPPCVGVGQVWFLAMTERKLGADCKFARFAAFTLAYARRDYSGLVKSIEKGWDTAGVTPDVIEDITTLLSNPPIKKLEKTYQGPSKVWQPTEIKKKPKAA